MATNQGAAKPAPKMTEQQIERDASWFGQRLKEPSTYGGLAVLLTFVFHLSNAQQLALNIQTIGMAVGTIILAVLAIVMPEKASRSAPPSVKAVAWFVILVGALGLAHPAHAAMRHVRQMSNNVSKHVSNTVPLPATDPRLAGLYDATRAPAPSGKPTVAQVQQNPLLLLQQIATADLQAALADAQAQNPPDTIAANCYQALINLKNNPAFALPSGTVPGVFTAIQKGRDLKTQLANLAAPNGPLANLNAACAAWNQDNLTTLINIGIAVGLVSNPAGATAAVASLPAQIAAFLAALPKL
jgi:hypothetical protein